MSERSADMPDRSSFASLSKDAQRRADELCDQFEGLLRDGGRPPIEDFLKQVSASDQPALLQELIVLEIIYRFQGGEAPTPDEYHERFPTVDKAWLNRMIQAPLEATHVAANPQPIAHGAESTQPSSLELLPEPPPMLGEYVLLDRLGEGGMGVVYRARHSRMGRLVAVKMLRFEAMTQAALVRFQREIQLLARLSHPNIVTAFDAGEQAGIHYLVMEYVDGEDLASLIARDGPLPIARAIQYLLQAAEGLRHAHEQGLVHRDVKPHNLFLTRNDVVKVLDLGLAQVVVSEGATESLASSGYRTQPGIILGSYHFLAPEQAANAQKADHRSDIYSLGCTLYYLLTGGPVYRGETGMEILLAHAQKPVVSLRSARPDVPVELDRVFQRMVAKRPEDRPQSLAEVSSDLRAAVGEASGTTVSPAVLPRGKIGGRLAVVSASVFVLLLLLGAAVHFSGLSPWSGNPPLAEEFTNSLDMKFRLVPAGSFAMGSAPEFLNELKQKPAPVPPLIGELGSESPIVPKAIDRPFYLGVTEVTNAQFEAFIRATNHRTDAERLAMGWGLTENGQWFQGKLYSWRNLGTQPRTPEHPAVSISWNDAMKFCAWLTETERQRTGKKWTYRLPTEVEWEYACRAGSESPWGPVRSPDQLGEYAWHLGNSGGRLHPVAQKKANAWGFFDMLGNEMEWCLDRYNADLRDVAPFADPLDPDSTERRILRGGAFPTAIEQLRPACRRVSHPASPTHGSFRVACVPE